MISRTTPAGGGRPARDGRKRNSADASSSYASTGSAETIWKDHALPLAAPAWRQPNRDLGTVGSPKMSVAPLQFLLLVFAGWVNRRQLEIVEFLQEENRVLREQMGGRRVHFTDAQRRRLAAKGKALGRRVLDQQGRVQRSVAARPR
jgi:hypothetical protein